MTVKYAVYAACRSKSDLLQTHCAHFHSLSHVIIHSSPLDPLPTLHTLTFLISTTYLLLTYH